MSYSRDSGSFLSLKRHEEYYLAGGDLFLLADHILFRVHRYFFERESLYFKGKLATPASPGTTRQGSNESNAIILENVRSEDFARFCWVFYNPKYSLYDAFVDDWTAILTLAHRWSFHEVKSLAVRQLETLDMSDIDRVVVYHDNEVDRNLLIPRYAALCEREEPLSLAEGRRLGLETSLTIAHTREVARRELPGLRSPSSPNPQGIGLFSIVRELFGIPIPEDDASPQTPPGGPTSTLPPPPPPTAPSMATPSVATPSTALPSKAPLPMTAQHTPQAEPRPQATVTPMAGPPTPPQEIPPPPPPPPPPKPMERLQVQTGRQKDQQAKNKRQQTVADPSRPQTPVPETPATEPLSQGPMTAAQRKKAAKKAAAKKKEEVQTGTATPRKDEVAGVSVAEMEQKDGETVKVEDEVKEKEVKQEEGKQKEQEELKKQEEQVNEKERQKQEEEKKQKEGEEKEQGLVEDKSGEADDDPWRVPTEAGTSDVPVVEPTANGEHTAELGEGGGGGGGGGEGTVAGDSTGETTATMTTIQGDTPKVEGTHTVLIPNPFESPTTGKTKRDIRNSDFLKSPQEKSTSGFFNFDGILDSFK